MHWSSVWLTLQMLFVFFCAVWAFFSGVAYAALGSQKILLVCVLSVPANFVGFCIIWQVAGWLRGDLSIIPFGVMITGAWFSAIPLVAAVVPLAVGLVRKAIMSAYKSR